MITSKKTEIYGKHRFLLNTHNNKTKFNHYYYFRSIADEVDRCTLAINALICWNLNGCRIVLLTQNIHGSFTETHCDFLPNKSDITRIRTILCYVKCIFCANVNHGYNMKIALVCVEYANYNFEIKCNWFVGMGYL